MTEIPNDQHITYQLQYRKCGKTSCSTCRNGQGHGPYWYAYWREGSRLKSGYVGKVHPNTQKIEKVPAQEQHVLKEAASSRNAKEAASSRHIEKISVTPALI